MERQEKILAFKTVRTLRPSLFKKKKKDLKSRQWWRIAQSRVGEIVHFKQHVIFSVITINRVFSEENEYARLPFRPEARRDAPNRPSHSLHHRALALTHRQPERPV